MQHGQSERLAREAAYRRTRLERPTVGLVHHVTLEPPRPAYGLLTASVGPDGGILALWSAPSAAAPVPAVVTASDPSTRTVAEIDDLRVAHPLIQPLPDGTVLIVGARAAWRSKGAERNAVVVDADGTRLREATLGDGIAHLQTTPSGDVWVGYFDEGVYGNRGWGGPGPDPIGRSGIVRFGPDLVMRWEFPSQLGHPGPVSDCYALNVDGEVGWTSYYTGFPVARIRGGEVTGWRNPVAGAAALAVAGNRILLAGGYAPERDRLVEGRLSAGEIEVVSDSRLTLPDGGEIPPHPVMIGRGPELTVILGVDCYRLAWW